MFKKLFGRKRLLNKVIPTVMMGVMSVNATMPVQAALPDEMEENNDRLYISEQQGEGYYYSLKEFCENSRDYELKKCETREDAIYKLKEKADMEFAPSFEFKWVELKKNNITHTRILLTDEQGKPIEGRTRENHKPVFIALDAKETWNIAGEIQGGLEGIKARAQSEGQKEFVQRCYGEKRKKEILQKIKPILKTIGWGGGIAAVFYAILSKKQKPECKDTENNQNNQKDTENNQMDRQCVDAALYANNDDLDEGVIDFK